MFNLKVEFWVRSDITYEMHSVQYKFYFFKEYEYVRGSHYDGEKLLFSFKEEVCSARLSECSISV